MALVIADILNREQKRHSIKHPDKAICNKPSYTIIQTCVAAELVGLEYATQNELAKNRGGTSRVFQLLSTSKTKSVN